MEYFERAAALGQEDSIKTLKNLSGKCNEWGMLQPVYLRENDCSSCQSNQLPRSTRRVCGSALSHE